MEIPMKGQVQNTKKYFEGQCNFLRKIFSHVIYLLYSDKSHERKCNCISVFK